MKKICIILSVTMLLILSLSNVFAYNITVKADFPDIVKQGDYVRFRMYTAASTSTSSYYNEHKGEDGWLGSTGYNPSATLGTFITKGIFFHNAPNCDYPGGGSTKYYYASYNSEYVGDTIKNMDSISNLDVPIENVTSKNYEEKLYRAMARGAGGDYGEERMSVLNTAASDGPRNNIYIADDYLSVDYVNEILDEFGITGEGSVYFSYDNQTALSGGNSMKTSRQFYNVTDGKWASNVRGYLNYDINQPDGLLSAINYYDNIMSFPDDLGGGNLKGKKVYVRQINLDDADIEKLSQSDLSERLSGNKEAPAINLEGKPTSKMIKATVEGDYQEVYTLRGNEGIIVSNVSSGMEYLGYVRDTTTKGRDNKIISRLKVTGKSATVEVLPNFKEDAIYIDFFYRKDDTKKKIETLSGTLNFQSILKDGMSGGAFEGMTEGQDNQNLTMDYIPPDELLKAGVLNAHPYVIQALDLGYYENPTTNSRYGDTRDIGYETVDITMKWDYEIEYQYSFKACCDKEDKVSVENCWEYEKSRDCRGKDGYKKGGTLTDIDETDGTYSKTKTYFIPYRYQYYKIKNFKLFKLKDITLHDTSGQEGGQLFEKADGTSLNLTQNYEDRFNASKTYLKVNDQNHWVTPSSHTWKMDYVFSRSFRDSMLECSEYIAAYKALIEDYNKKLDQYDGTKAEFATCMEDSKDEVEKEACRQKYEEKMTSSELGEYDKINNGYDTCIENAENEAALEACDIDYDKQMSDSNNIIYKLEENIANVSSSCGEGSRYTYIYKGGSSKSEKAANRDANSEIEGMINQWSDSTFANNMISEMKVKNDTLLLEGVPLISESLLSAVINLSSYKTVKDDTTKKIDLNCTPPNINLINALRPNANYNFSLPKPLQMNEYRNYHLIPLTRENGLRRLSATLEYQLITDNGAGLNTGGTDNQNDNMYSYPLYNNKRPYDNKWNFNKLHTVEGTSHVEPVVVHAPIKAGGLLQNDQGVIDQTTEGIIPVDTIQKNSKFQIVPNSGGAPISEHPRYIGGYNGPITFEKYIKGYFVTFNFDVQVPGRGETIYNAGSWVYFDKSEPIIVQANKRISEGMGNVVEEKTNTYMLRTVAINATDRLIERVVNGDLDMSYVGNGADNGNDLYNAQYASGPCYKNGQYIWAHGKRLLQEATYMVQTKPQTTTNLDRMYDFRVTDLLDVDWKNVFRKYDNTHTENYYTAGRRGWNMYSGELNETGNITESTPDGKRTDIGKDPYRVLPIGPYKHVNNQYTTSPKMGYRFSFDLKTTGEIKEEKQQTKKIDIRASFYYISKDGKTYYNSNEIDLYYQDTSGKYVKIQEGKNTGYTIKMRPSDGYRYIDKYNTANMLSTSLIEVSSDLVNIRLASNTNMTRNEKDFTQLWYGEYKLPNSTIAVLNSNAGGSSDVNKPLKDGYIGVKFDITLTETEKGVVIRKLTYNTNSKGKGENSSQWDYEGHMSVYDAQAKSIIDTGSISNSNTVFIPLEKGSNTYNGAKGITVGNIIEFNKYNSSGKFNKVSMTGNAFYNEIKGTVIMYDTDAKASEDFDFSGSN